MNCLRQRPLFGSGTPEAGKRNAVTVKSERFVHGDLKYTDTPGLADVDDPKNASQQSMKALNLDETNCLAFVLKLDSLRIRVEDVTTIFTVLEA